jgi:hypothetical protein
MLVCGLESWVDWSSSGRYFYSGPGGDTLVYTGDGELFDRNVETVTDNAEYRSGSVSAREVGWQTCPGLLFIGVSESESAFRS